MSLTSAADTRLGALLSAGLLAVNVASVASSLGFLHKAKDVKEYDHWRYIEMARGPEGKPELQREPPYCFRLAVPALARGLTRLGLAENASFDLVTNAALFGFLLLLWLHLRDLGFSLALRVTGLLVTGFTQGAVRWFEYQYWMSDPVALCLVMLAFFLVERGRRWASLVATSVAAAFVRETYVLVYPYVFLRELRLGRGLPGALARTSALCALPLVILVAIRMTVTPNQPDDFAAGIVDSMTFRLNHLLDNQLYVVSIGAFGVLVPMVLLLPRRLPELARRHFDRALFVAIRLRHARDLEQQRAAARVRAAGARSRGALLPAGVPRDDTARSPAGARGSGRAAGPVLDRPALRRDRHEHLPARQLDDRRRDGRRLARGPGRQRASYGPCTALTANVSAASSRTITR